MDSLNTPAILRQNPLFSILPDEEINFLAETLHCRSLSSGEMLFREGEFSEKLYIVVEGTAEILKSAGSPEERLLGLRGPGSLFGEMALFSKDKLRTASIRAQTGLRVLEMTSGDFDGLLRRRPELAYGIASLLTQRLHSSENATIRDLQEKNRQLQLAYEELKAAQEQIIEKEKLEKELAVARQLQMSILPHSLPRFSGFDVKALTIPAKSVGGDFFDVISLTDARLGIAVADVSDKGIPAALFMTMTYSLLRAEAARASDPVEVLRNVNQHLLGMNSAGMFVTVLYGILDIRTRLFDYARAGHDQPIVLSPEGHFPSLPFEEGQILGVLDQPLIDRCTVPLPIGSTMIIYSDGVTEAATEHSELFGKERLQDAIRTHRNETASTLANRLLDELNAHRGAGQQNDDITLLVLKSIP